MRKILIGFAGLVLAASLALLCARPLLKKFWAPGPGRLAVLMGEGYIVVTGADGHQYQLLCRVPQSARSRSVAASPSEVGGLGPLEIGPHSLAQVSA